MLPALSFLIRFRTPIALAILAAVFALGVWRYNITIAENKRLLSELQKANNAVTLLGEKMDTEAGISINADKLKNEVEKIESAPVPPDIDAAIDGIERLRKN